MIKKLNLGCGRRFRSGWTNIDQTASPPDVIGHDLRRPLPFRSGEFDFVYSSHVLEHFCRTSGQRFLSEKFRILKSEGIIRCVVPDLEYLAQNYLKMLDLKRSTFDEETDASYTWSVLALVDQCCRNESGGEMKRFLQTHDGTTLAKVFEFEGEEIRNLHHSLQGSHHDPIVGAKNLWHMPARLKALGLRVIKHLFFNELQRKKFQIGAFRLAGEVHYAMYDEVSLAQALTDAGFVDVVRRNACESAWSDWASETLDTLADGSVYKPASLFMEARKPL